MQKKQYFSMAYLIFLALLIGVAILISKPSEKKNPDDIRTYNTHSNGNSDVNINKIKSKKYNKVYFLTDEGLFSYNPKGAALERISSGTGTYSNLFLTDDERYIAFCYITNGNISNLAIIDCSDNTFIVKDNKDMQGNTIAKENKTSKYSYQFLKWEDNNKCKLLQSAISKHGSIKIKENIIYYSINGK